jgi:hypothetical protein
MVRLVLCVLATTTALSSIPLSGHENFRIVGTIVKFERWQLQVATAAGESFAITLQESTPIERDKKSVSATELKPGRSVVIDVMGDTPYDYDLYVVSVRLVPPIAPRRGK